MSIEIKVPVLPESVSDATIASWHKKPGEFIKRDENLVDVETDKVVLEVVAPQDGYLETILKPEGSIVGPQELIAWFTENLSPKKEGVETVAQSPLATTLTNISQAPSVVPVNPAVNNQVTLNKQPELEPANNRPIIASQNLSPSLRRQLSEKATETQPTIKVEKVKTPAPPIITSIENSSASNNRPEKRVPMTRLRARIAQRLISAQQNSAILTTFNEINMQGVMNLRAKNKDAFEKKFGVRLGFMSFFTTAVIEALKQFPSVNASIDNQDIIYHGYYDIGIAVSSPRGLVVPILRDADLLGMHEIEQKIAEFGKKSLDGQLTLEEMTGGTFTISNGGVFGSLMSTPIINPPQSAILGMHKIQERPVVENGQILIRPMMYVALSYDHRLIDGSESVKFLVAIKEYLENPLRFVFGL
ncbi:MAG: 2-oxoglutarate dehydrogenase component [Francisellaceae bacterium]|nr:2-oxoglutarate dehydrogenase component [Francisellaceae bacterium]